MRKLRKQSRSLHEEPEKKVKKNLRGTEEQLENKPKKNLRRTEEQLESKPKKVFGSNLKTREELENKLENEVEKKLRRTEEQLEKNMRYTQLVGGQKNIMRSLFLEAYKNGEKITPPLTVRFIAESSGVPHSSVRKSIQILEKKGCISRYNFKNGRGGWTEYLIHSMLYGEMLQLKSEEQLEKNLRKTEEQLEYKPKNKLENFPHSSSRALNLKNTTTIESVDNFSVKHKIMIPEELSKIGFHESHLNQITDVTNLNEVELQESLNHYALDLRNGSVRAGYGKLNLIVGVLKKSNLYVSESYIAEEQAVLKELVNRAEMLKELKSKQAEIELLKKYKAWKKNLTQEEINELAPPSNIVEEGGTLQDIQLQSYFQENHANIIN